MNEEAIFLAALDKDPGERAGFLDEACAGDTTLRLGVESLLRLHSETHDFLDVPAIEQLAAADPGPGNTAADLSFLAPTSEPGSLGRLDHYEVLEVVGRGATGIVLRARDTKLLRVVAIKALAAPLAASGTARQRFAREARAAAAIRDEHVVDIHAVCDDAPMPYMVMEFIAGCSLEALVHRGGPLDVKQVLRIGIQVASGLAAAHKHGLVHRDVKPANILLENGVQRVKLTDFRPGPRRRRRQPDAERLHRRHTAVHGPGAGGRRAARPTQRSVQPGQRALRDVYRSARLPGDDHRGGHPAGL
jgi:tRNA A-37 threonylcarbamoyl transferase component Bud32